MDNIIIGYKTGRKIVSFPPSIGKNPVIRSGTVIYESVKIGDNLETGHNVIIREENIIGNNFNIWNNSTIDYGCKIGHNVKIHCNVYIAQYTIIEDEVFIAPGVTVANDLHPVCTKCMKGPLIKKNAKIGINVTILPHLTIGEYALIGAGSVVTIDIPDFMIACGNPAKIIGSIKNLKCKAKIKEKVYDL